MTQLHTKTIISCENGSDCVIGLGLLWFMTQSVRRGNVTYLLKGDDDTCVCLYMLKYVNDGSAVCKKYIR